MTYFKVSPLWNLYSSLKTWLGSECESHDETINEAHVANIWLINLCTTLILFNNYLIVWFLFKNRPNKQLSYCHFRQEQSIEPERELGFTKMSPILLTFSHLSTHLSFYLPLCFFVWHNGSLSLSLSAFFLSIRFIFISLAGFLLLSYAQSLVTITTNESCALQNN